MNEKEATVIMRTGEAAERLREAVVDECRRCLATDFERSVPDILAFWGAKIGLSADELADVILNRKT